MSAFLAAVLLAGPASGRAGEEAENAETVQIRFTYYSTIAEEKAEDTLTFSDQWFRKNPEERNDRLGLASACLAVSYRDGEETARMLRELGFSDAETRRQDSDETGDCAYAIGTRPLNRNGEQATLIALVMQGLKYGAKGWRQNVTVNTDGSLLPDHESYAEAARIVAADLAEMDFAGTPVYWICGMSRGGAIASLTAARLIEQGNTAVYCCTFESPGTTQRESAGESLYGGIHNYLCGDDPVTMLPCWGMRRYGQEYSFDGISMKSVRAVLGARNPELADYPEGVDADTFHADVQERMTRAIRKLEELIPDREVYSSIRTVAVSEDSTIQVCWQSSLQALVSAVFERKKESGGEKKEPGGGKKESAFGIQWEDLATEAIRFRKNELAESAGEDPGAVIRKRWVYASTLALLALPLTRGTILQTDAYALLEILDGLIAADSADGEESAADPEGLVSYGTALLFSHYEEVILARMKILAGETAGENGSESSITDGREN